MTNPKQPGSGQTPASPSHPTPEDPREHEPMRDPPIYPEHDGDEGEIHEAAGIEALDPSPDGVVYENAD
ncbi:MAG TPA: hypothetical protein VK820_00755 [Steroidobacteraceae bacterium]|jgi:hypothetical protein|nr:hypothetical protein [Steroidobacteraceae bacterium]